MLMITDYTLNGTHADFTLMDKKKKFHYLKRVPLIDLSTGYITEDDIDPDIFDDYIDEPEFLRYINAYWKVAQEEGD